MLIGKYKKINKNPPFAWCATKAGTAKRELPWDPQKGSGGRGCRCYHLYLWLVGSCPGRPGIQGDAKGITDLFSSIKCCSIRGSSHRLSLYRGLSSVDFGKCGCGDLAWF